MSDPWASNCPCKKCTGTNESDFRRIYHIEKLYNKKIWKLKKLIKETKDKFELRILKMVYLQRCKRPDMLIINQMQPKLFIYNYIKPYIRNTLRRNRIEKTEIQIN